MDNCTVFGNSREVLNAGILVCGPIREYVTPVIYARLSTHAVICSVSSCCVYYGVTAFWLRFKGQILNPSSFIKNKSGKNSKLW